MKYNVTVHSDTYGYIPRDCDICGSISNPEDVNAHVEGWCGSRAIRSYVCDSCVESGSAGIKEVLLEHGNAEMAKAEWCVIPMAWLLHARKQHDDMLGGL